jgi:Tfp pilus assembly protein PilO
MSMTERDKKIIFLLLPLLVIMGFWFLILAPKRKEASQVANQLTQAQSKRDTSQSQLSHLMAAKNSFANDYATVIRLGKAVPTSLDMASLMVQLNTAAQGTGIEFTKVDAGQRSNAPTPSTPPAGGGSGPTAPGAAPAQSGTGKTAQNAANGVNNANAQNGANAAAAGGTGSSGSSSTTPAGGASGAQGPSGAQGLDSVPLNFEFTGNFFNLADFFHRLKRFVRVVNSQIEVNGRLLTIDSLNFDATQAFPNIKANVGATVYLSPAAQGVTDGATPQGPSTAPASSTGAPSSSSSSTPTAAVTP